MSARPLDILILGHNYAPELVGIGPCTTGMAVALAASGNRVRVICGQPSYPQWKVVESYRTCWPRRTIEDAVSVLRLPLYVRGEGRGLHRILHHLSFALLAGFFLMGAWRRRPDVIVAVAPSIATTLMGRIAGWWLRRPVWIHVQDFERELAAATGHAAVRIMNSAPVRLLERISLRGARVSTISHAMRQRLIDYGNPPHAVHEFSNWANPDVARR